MPWRKALILRNSPVPSTPLSVKVAPPPPPWLPLKVKFHATLHPACGSFGSIVGKGSHHEVRNLPCRLVLEPAGLLVELVAAGVRGSCVPELLREVLAEFGGIDRDDLEPVLALLEPLKDGVGEQPLPLLPVVGVEDPRLVPGRGSDCRAEERHRRRHQRRTAPRCPHACLREGFGCSPLFACSGSVCKGNQLPGALSLSFSSSQWRIAPTRSTRRSPARRA